MVLADLVSSATTSAKSVDNADETRDGTESLDSDSSDDESEDDSDEEQSEESESEAEEEEEAPQTLDPAELAILRSAGVLPEPRKLSKRWHRQTSKTSHIIFVDDENAGRPFQLLLVPDQSHAYHFAPSKRATTNPISHNWPRLPRTSELNHHRTWDGSSPMTGKERSELRRKQCKLKK